MLTRISSIVAVSFLVACSHPDAPLVPATAASPDAGSASGDDRCSSQPEAEGCMCNLEGAVLACGTCGTRRCALVAELLLWGPCDEPPLCASPPISGEETPSDGGPAETGETPEPSNPPAPAPSPNPGPAVSSEPVPKPSSEPVPVPSSEPAPAPSSAPKPAPSPAPKPAPSPAPKPAPSPSPMPCMGDCVPGGKRWCDDPLFCHYGRQLCGPDGRWGACVEVTSRPPGCDGDDYDTECCVASGQCCQNFGGTDPDASVGNCAGISCR